MILRGLKWYDVIRKYQPDATDDDCHYILWEHTAFPLTDEFTIHSQIKKYFQSVGD
ncbi:hypothetical protein [Aquibacillus saliphilus]|uniref:hypothetical protein n=1 Tax=Aquibacillus saliphilus TaxID=1909422 RepID=UPI001CEFFC4C|nr:hypothetical protein [Aquibacillus saliphilus]